MQVSENERRSGGQILINQSQDFLNLFYNYDELSGNSINSISP